MSGSAKGEGLLEDDEPELESDSSPGGSLRSSASVLAGAVSFVLMGPTGVISSARSWWERAVLFSTESPMAAWEFMVSADPSASTSPLVRACIVVGVVNRFFGAANHDWKACCASSL